MTGWPDRMHENEYRAAARIGGIGERSAYERAGPWSIAESGLRFPLVGAASLVEPVDDPAAAIALAEAWYERAGFPPRFQLRDAADRLCIEALQAAGYEVVASHPAMLLESLPSAVQSPGGLRVIPITTFAQAEEYARVADPEWRPLTVGLARHALALPGFTMFTGFVRGEPVATSLAYLSGGDGAGARGGMVGVYNVAVQEPYRRRGIGAAMTLAAIEHGRRAGATAATLQSTEMALSLYESLGFRTIYSYVRLARR